MGGIFGGGTTKPPEIDDGAAKEQRRKLAIAQANQRGRQSTVLGKAKGLGSNAPELKRKTALGG